MMKKINGWYDRWNEVTCFFGHWLDQVYTNAFHLAMKYFSTRGALSELTFEEASQLIVVRSIDIDF